MEMYFICEKKVYLLKDLYFTNPILFLGKWVSEVCFIGSNV